MTLKVIGAGVGRTGTMSLKAALEKLLGAPCYHMTEVFAHREHIALWQQAFSGDSPDWDAMLKGYAATVDWPAAARWRELAGANPDALVLLSERDPESWYASASQTIFNAAESATLPDGFKAMAMSMFAEFTPDVRDKDATISAFNAHNAAVKATVPPERLLVWRAAEGWEPICKRLDLPVPQEPFPRTNSREEFNARGK